ncbi:hypothetical protein [Pedobacter hiemivivus]|uniref:Uncharacterized protein n=1 Tax=Pedobacter hiemivivus TaxID=2530454 RepID=A0A4R0NBD1_9SPHI|nr:hypothetical protein [Pedobacter hiemivivus]TCC96927.1 hypothetical protein EZ444_08655 [Pedobacter hiemivivus]
MKTFTLIFALSFIGSIAFGQAKVSNVGTLKGTGGGAAAASYAATGKVVLPSDTPKTSTGSILPQKTAVLGGTVPGASVISSAKQTQGTTFGEKVNQGLHAAGSSAAIKTENPLYQGSGAEQNNPLHKTETKVANPGTPIGGVIVKGKN